MNFDKLLELGPWGVAAALVAYLAAKLITRGFSVQIKVGDKR